VLSSTGTPASLIEPQSAWNVRQNRRTGGLDLDVLYSAEANTQMDQRMHQNTHFEIKNEQFLWKGG